MSTAFQDVKPWPKAAPPAVAANPRATIGGNNPPLEERILMDFDDALRGHDGLIERIDAMVAKADQAGPCTSADIAGRYGDFIKMTAAVAKVIEAERETLNRPLLNAQRSLKGRADQYSARATGAGAKVRALLDTFLADQERKRRAEEARLAQVAREAEQERQRKIAEQEKAAREAAEAERKRQQEIEDARAAKEAREAVVVEVAPEAVLVPEPEPVFVSAPTTKAPLRGDLGTAVSTVETWDVKVTNIRQVPDAYLKHPTVIEALEKVIRPQVRGKNGLREIKGCEISSKLGSAVR